MKRFTSFAAAGVLASMFALAQPAQAEGTALNRFEPAPAGDRFFGVQAPGTLGHLELHAMLLADYAHNPFVLTHRRGVGDVMSVVEHQLFMHANVSLGLWRFLTVGVDVPVAVAQDGSDALHSTGMVLAPDSAQLGDIRIHARGTFFGEPSDAFQIGLGAYLWAPSGARDGYVSDGSARGAVELLVGGLSGPVYWNVALGPQLRKSQQLIGVEQGSAFYASGGLGVLLGQDRQVQVGPEFRVGVPFNEPGLANINAEAMLGAKYRFANDFLLGAAGGPGISEGIGTPDVRAVATFAYSPRLEDRAAPPVDGDNDGIADEDDLCPAQAAGARVDPDRLGCPAPVDGDGDADGVPDRIDRCPDKPAAVDKADPDRPGCEILDGDGDGFADGVDQCPAIAGPDSGCPGDGDGDGIRDDVDACPGVRGLEDGDSSKNGCPKIVRLRGKEIVILQQVQFATGRAEVKAESAGLLDEVAQVMNDRADILKVEVAGYTDNVGNANVNRNLSERRAQAVVQELIKRGVAAERMTAKGYGPDTPIADNATKEGQAKNRRVEFKILERKSK